MEDSPSSTALRGPTVAGNINTVYAHGSFTQSDRVILRHPPAELVGNVLVLDRPPVPADFKISRIEFKMAVFSRFQDSSPELERDVAKGGEATEFLHINRLLVVIPTAPTSHSHRITPPLAHVSANTMTSCRIERHGAVGRCVREREWCSQSYRKLHISSRSSLVLRSRLVIENPSLLKVD